MQQRPASLSRAPEENHMIKVTQQTQHQHAKYSSPGGIAMDESALLLPLYFHSSTLFRRSAAEKSVHAIPFIVMFCLFTLWWFSSPVNVVIKDGKIVAIHRIHMPQPLNNNVVELAILASATSPVAMVPHNLTINNETEEVQPVHKID